VGFVLDTGRGFDTATRSGLDLDAGVGFVLGTCAVFGWGPGVGGAEDADVNTGTNPGYERSRTLTFIFQQLIKHATKAIF
jgi:hypothetical protein